MRKSESRQLLHWPAGKRSSTSREETGWQNLAGQGWKDLDSRVPDQKGKKERPNPPVLWKKVGKYLCILAVLILSRDINFRHLF